MVGIGGAFLGQCWAKLRQFKNSYRSDKSTIYRVTHIEKMDLMIVILTSWITTYYFLYYFTRSYTINIFKTNFISRTFRFYTVSTLLSVVNLAPWDPGTHI